MKLLIINILLTFGFLWLAMLLIKDMDLNGCECGKCRIRRGVDWIIMMAILCLIILYNRL